MSYGTETPPGAPPRHMRRRRLILISTGSVVGLFILLIIVGITGNSHSQSQLRAARNTGLVRLHYGQKAVLSKAWTSDGIVSATVYGFQTPFTSQTDNRPDAGDQFAVSRVQVCAGSNGANTTNQLLPFPFQLDYPHSQTFGALDGPDAAKEPDVSNVANTLRTDRCVNAYVTFQFTKGSPPLAVGWGNPDQPAYEWTAVG